MSASDSTMVFVVDDDAAVRRGVGRLLRSAGHTVELLESAADFLARPVQNGAACLVLDIAMPELDGMELQEQLAARGDTIPIVFITGHGDIPMSVRAMKAGASDFLPKPFDDRDLLHAVRTALEASSRECVYRAEKDALRKRFETLTPREREVFSYVITGMLNKQIAAELDIAEKTVKVHRGRVTEKLGVASVAELVRIGARLGIDGPE